MLRTDPVKTTVPPGTLIVRTAGPADHAEIENVVRSAYRQYSGLMLPPQVFEHYLDDLLDLDRHARHGYLLVVEVDGRIRASGAFYADASAQGLGLPPGWAGGRGLAVHPDVRGRGVASTLLAECERLARTIEAPVFAFHTVSFMSGAVALYERLGYRRAPEFDFDLGARYGLSTPPRTTAITYRRDLTRAHAERLPAPGRGDRP
jgi:GNAT superfamily N-acetyltransferase